VALSWQSIDLRSDPDEARYEGDPDELVGALADMLAELTARPAWHGQAACRGKGPALFFPEKWGSTEAAKALCAGCDVRSECLDDALAAGHHQDGVWGGLSAQQRRKLRRQRAPGEVA
jgi:WhiB family redox-sensing transcriptional regulator